jgi:hydroxymethylpyrimidine/phosphomethylpyrimidine kinase
VKHVLTIGGSDSSGGAGIAADLKVLHALSIHASTVITAVTAQNSLAVTDVHDVPPDSIRAQLAAVLSDVPADAVKTGMLSSPGAVYAVVEALTGEPLVVDPVGVSSTGATLLVPAALDLLRSRLLPLATVVTPNLAEVAALTGVIVTDEDQLLAGAEAVLALGPTWVLVTGGHLPGDPTDLLYDGTTEIRLRGLRIDTRHTHGTGCTLAAAIAGHLALGLSVPEAVVAAKDVVTEAIRRGYPHGRGAGPVRA